MTTSFAAEKAATTKANAAMTKGTASASHQCFACNIILAAMLNFVSRTTFSPSSKNARRRSQVACILAMIDSLAKICVSSGKGRKILVPANTPFADSCRTIAPILQKQIHLRLTRECENMHRIFQPIYFTIGTSETTRSLLYSYYYSCFGL